MAQAKRLKVFLCHASQDKEAVRELYKRLTNDGIDAWLDEEKLLGGQKWEIEIPKAVRESDVVIICLSPNSTNKEGYVQKEIRIALDAANEKLEETIFIIPVRLRECTPPERLKSYQWIDLFRENGYEKLMRSLEERAKDINATLKSKTEKRKTSKKANDTPVSVNSIKSEAPQNETHGFSQTSNASKQNSPRRKLKLSNPTIIAAIITAIATILAGLFGFEPFVDLFTKSPATTKTPSQIQTPFSIAPTDITIQEPLDNVILNNEPTNLFIQFFVDNSTSMRGCETSESINPFTNYMLTTLEKIDSFRRLRSNTEKANLYVTFSTFGIRINNVIRPIEISKLLTNSEYINWIKSSTTPNYISGDGYYSDIFDSAIKNTNVFDDFANFKHIIIIITDGTTVDKNRAVNEVFEGLVELNSLSEQPHIYIAVCTNPLGGNTSSFWNEIDNLEFADVVYDKQGNTENTIEWGKIIFNDSYLINYLPEFSTWITPSEVKTINIPLDSSDVWLEFSPIDSAGRVNIGGEFSGILTNGNPTSFSLLPNNHCSDFVFEASASRSGLLLTSFQRPNWSPQLLFLSPEIVDTSFEYLFKLKFENFSPARLETLSSCLQIRLNNFDHPLVPVECAPGQLICTNDNSLESKWKLLSTETGSKKFPPESIQVYLYYKPSGNQINTWDFDCSISTESPVCYLHSQQ